MFICLYGLLGHRLTAWRAQMVYYSLYIAFTIAGNVGHDFFYAFHMIDIVVRYKSLTIVLQAVAR